MAHNINSMMYVGARPWHGLGKELENVATAEQAILAAGLGWTVEPRAVFQAVGPDKYSEIPGKRAITRNDTGHVFNVMSDGYTPVQNREAFGFFDSVVGDGQAIYHTAGALGAGERVWILAKLPGDIVIEGTDDRTEKFLLLSNSHDGTSALRMFFTPVRVVCQNTLNIAMGGRGKGEGISLRHTVNIMKNVNEAQRALGLAVTFYNGLGNTMNELAARAISRETLKAYFTTLIPDNKEADRNTRTVNIRQSMETNFLRGRGNNIPGVAGSWYAAVNAVTEYVDHDRSARGQGLEQTSNRLESQWFGSGAKIKAEAWDLALDMAGVKTASN